MNWLDVSVGAAGGVQSVTADNGLTASGTTDVTVSGVDATVAVKGVVQLTDTVATNSTLAVTGTAVEGYAVPLNINPDWMLFPEHLFYKFPKIKFKTYGNSR